VKDVVKVACVQAEPVAFDRAATIDKIDGLAADVAGNGARLARFPEAFIPVYPSNRWVRYLAGWGGAEAGEARDVFARLAQQSVTIPGPDSDRLAEIARTHGIWLAVGANELERGTIYNSLLVYSPEGELALHHRKLMPTNHERLVWGLGDGNGLEAVATDVGKVGGLICWENLMPLARFALYQSGVEVYLAPTADDSEDWQDSMKHIAREARAFVLSCCVFQRVSSYPEDVPLAEGHELLGAGGSAILAPDGSYLAGPLWNEEGVLYAELDPQLLYAARQRFDPAGHYHRPDVFQFGFVTSRSGG
jgi:nitrilase